MKHIYWNYPKKQNARLDMHCYPSFNAHERCTGMIETTIGKAFCRSLNEKCQCKCHSKGLYKAESISKTMNVVEPSILNNLFNALYEEYDVKREGVHVSDITFCPRKTCYQKIDPLPLDNKQLNFFTSGKAIHAALESLAKRYPYRYELEKEVKFDGIEAHIDIFDKELNMPIEAKSARTNKMLEPKAHYVSQLEAYMAMTDSDTGLILVQLLLHYNDRPFVEFIHHMTKEQRQKKLADMKNDARLLLLGIENADPEIVRHIAYDDKLNWLCNSCKYSKECLKLRDEERKQLWDESVGAKQK